MTTTVLAPYLTSQFFGNNGAFLNGGQLFTYQAGTNTPIATWVDSTGVTPNTNPIVLNARGECSIWLIPNTAYKFVLQDSSGNPIWTRDQVTQSQLITLYGGVDTGSTNAYLLTFSASFTSYVDGIIIVWIPSHSNTAGSTINVNGLGVVNILNSDGSSLIAGQLLANQPAQILFKGGSFILLATNGTAGTFVGAWSGFSLSPSTIITWKKIGNLVTLIFSSSTGTSNGSTFILTGLPAALLPITAVNQAVPIAGLIDNGATLTTTTMVTISSAGIIQFSKDYSGAAWTAAGSKGFAYNAIFTYSI